MNLALEGERIPKETEIQAFVARFLTSLGVAVTSRDYGLEARLTDEAARLLGCRRTLRLAFGSGESIPADSTLVTFGHPLLDRMLAVAKERGEAAHLMFTFSMAPDFVEGAMGVDPFSGTPSARGEFPEGGVLAELVRQGEKIRVANARVRIVGRRITHQRQVLFYFKVSFISDDKWEMTVPLLMDPLTEEVDRPVDVSEAVSFIPRGVAKASREQDEYTVGRLYRKACDHLQRRLAHRIHAFETEAMERARRESARIHEYYKGLASESLEPLRKLFRRISATGVRADMARSWHAQTRYHELAQSLKEEARELEQLYRKEVEGLEKEKEQRLREVREKHRPRLEIALTHAAYVMVPRLEWRLRLVRPDQDRELPVLYDLMRRRFVGWACESCERPFGESASLCSCGALVCHDCHAPCRDCGGDNCPLCASEECHICRRSTCPTCDNRCPIGLRELGLELPSVCSSCRAAWCHECAAGATLHL